jgi:drug/metabolite transporter (DMT)-like permease
MKTPVNIYLIITILCWSATPAVAKLALYELNNLQLLFYTSIIGAISLFLVTLFQKKFTLIKNFKKQDYLKMAGMGTLGILLYYILLFGSFAIAPAGQANVVNYLWPIFIIIFSIPILEEKFNYKTIIAILISFAGALIVFTRGDFSSFSNEYTIGYLLAAGAAVCYGLFSVLGKKFHYEKFISMFFYYVFATMLIIPSVLLTSNFVIPQSITTIISILLLGGIFNSIAFVFWFKALKAGHTHKTANMIYLVPFLALIWTYFLNSEPITLFSIMGLILIITGIAIQMRNKI